MDEKWIMKIEGGVKEADTKYKKTCKTGYHKTSHGNEKIDEGNETTIPFLYNGRSQWKSPG